MSIALPAVSVPQTSTCHGATAPQRPQDQPHVSLEPAQTLRRFCLSVSKQGPSNSAAGFRQPGWPETAVRAQTVPAPTLSVPPSPPWLLSPVERQARGSDALRMYVSVACQRRCCLPGNRRFSEGVQVVHVPESMSTPAKCRYRQAFPPAPPGWCTSRGRRCGAPPQRWPW